MKSQKKLGHILIGLAILIIISMAMNNQVLWLVTDVLMILVCAIAGWALIKKR
ncbi:hypothetical protein JW826_02330 [Candidatus Woesearchaeota archaeon]|nr:hypothetical protein [Candidatus Woesearchaeota archaeon]